MMEKLLKLPLTKVILINFFKKLIAFHSAQEIQQKLLGTPIDPLQILYQDILVILVIAGYVCQWVTTQPLINLPKT